VCAHVGVRETVHRSIRRLRFIQGKNKRREKILPLLWTMVFLHIYRTACLSTHTHTRSNLFKRYGYEFFCFWRGKHGGTSFYRRTRAFRFASRSSFEAAIPRVFAFFLFPSAAKVIFLPPPLVAGGGTLRDFSERCEGEFERRTRKGHRGILLGRELRVESLLRRCFRALFVRYPTR